MTNLELLIDMTLTEDIQKGLNCEFQSSDKNKITYITCDRNTMIVTSVKKAHYD